MYIRAQTIVDVVWMYLLVCAMPFAMIRMVRRVSVELRNVGNLYSCDNTLPPFDVLNQSLPPPVYSKAAQ